MGNTKALVIDDTYEDCVVLTEMLADESVTSVFVQDPRDLETTLDKLDRVDVVFLDLEMPGLNGYEVLDNLKSIHNLAVPIVAYTVHLSESATANQMGFDCFIGKPLDVTRFPDQLRRILAGQRVWEPR